VVRARFGDEWAVRLVPGVQHSYFVEGRGANGERLPDEVAVSAVDRAGQEGPVVALPSSHPARSVRPARPRPAGCSPP